MALFEFEITDIFGIEHFARDTKWTLVLKEKNNRNDIKTLTFHDISYVLQNSSFIFSKKIPTDKSKSPYFQIPLCQGLKLVFYVKRRNFWTQVTVSYHNSRLRIEPVSKVFKMDEEIVNQLLSCFALESDQKITFLYQKEDPRIAQCAKEKTNVD